MNSIMTTLLAQDMYHPATSLEHAAEARYWFPIEASAFAKDIDNLFMAITWISAFFFVIIIGVMCYFVVKYRRREGVKPEPSSSHNTTIEILWSVLPSIILVWIFYEGASGYYEMRMIPDSAEEIHAEAFQFGWEFTYPDGDKSTELHVIKDRPTKLILQSRDVLHSFYVAAFRQKMDIVPNRYTYAYLLPTVIGEFRLACAEYCGDNHSRMRTICVVHPDDADRKVKTQWIKAEHSPWINGQHLFKIHCAGCHNINGVAGTGPALNLIWDKDENLIDGSTVKVDENYIKESILQPNAKVVSGYGPVSKMQNFEGKLSNGDIDDLIAFIKLKDGMANPPPDEGSSAVKEETNESPAPANTTAVAPSTDAAPEVLATEKTDAPKADETKPADTTEADGAKAEEKSAEAPKADAADEKSAEPEPKKVDGGN